MFYASIENENSKIELGGEYDSPFEFKIESITGIGQVEADEQVVQYVDMPGVRTLKRTPKAREIIITGVIENTGNLEYLKTTSAHVFDNTKLCTLKIDSNGKRRKIIARPNIYELGAKNQCYQNFVLQLKCDSPFFTDFESTFQRVSFSMPKLKTPFQLPMVFSQSFSQADIYNWGDIETQPLITINCVGSGAGFIIENITTGKSINVDYATSDGEILKIDISSDIPRIISNVNGDVTRYKSRYTILSEFILAVGVNDIKVTKVTGTQKINVTCEHYNKYIEAVV